MPGERIHLMAENPELWAFVLANIGLFVISSVLAGVSYVAYRQSGDQASYRLATIGFGFVSLGGLVEPVYQLIVRDGPSVTVTGTELLWLQAGEGILIAGGLGLLFYAITHHDSGSSSAEEMTYKFDPQEMDD